MSNRVQDIKQQREIMDKVDSKKEAKKMKKERDRQAKLKEGSERMAKGLKKTGVSMPKKQTSKTTAERAGVPGGEKSAAPPRTTKVKSKNDTLSLENRYNKDPEKEYADQRKREMFRDEVVRSNGVYPHSSMLLGPQRRAGGQVGGAVPVMCHSGVYGVSVVNNGIFLSRKVITAPAVTRRRSIVAQRSSPTKEREEKELEEDQRGGGGGAKEEISPHRLWLAQKEENLSSSSSSSSLKKYAPYTDTALGAKEEAKKEKKNNDANCKEEN
jgi:hypothetical protein